jgi:hypothetical protein
LVVTSMGRCSLGMELVDDQWHTRLPSAIAKSTHGTIATNPSSDA